ncbi:MAG TPA: TatD family hydrolase [Ktedonobacterales bacterium]|nr:TatD family hydrolase [Ktedonobacterales bacterium]
MSALVDSHAHVQMRQFDADREQVIAAAFADGVTQMVTPGTDVETSKLAIELAARYPGRIFAAVGTHPHDATTLTDAALAEQRELARSPHVVAIGEIGLDYYRNLSPREAQRDAITRQFALARELDLPVILHNRESHADMVELLRAEGQELRGVFHCFIGDQTMARDALDLGFYLSFAGPVTFPKNIELAEVAAWAPIDRMLVETDCPYLTPTPFRGRRNEPRHVAQVARRIAELRDITFDQMAEATSRNAATLFRLAPPPENGA